MWDTEKNALILNSGNRFKIPFHQAILLELQEEGHEEAARYVKELLEIDEKMNEQKPGTVTWKKMHLKDQKEFVLRLKDGLVAFEKARRKGTTLSTTESPRYTTSTRNWIIESDKLLFQVITSQEQRRFWTLPSSSNLELGNGGGWLSVSTKLPYLLQSTSRVIMVTRSPWYAICTVDFSFTNVSSEIVWRTY